MAAQKRTSRVSSIPAPIGGWNARDSVSNMDPLDAVRLENWFPRATDVLLRQGYTLWSTGLPGQVESLMPYNNATTSTLFAASSTGFYNVTAQGAVGAAVQTGLTNARWQSCNITTAGGSYMQCVNGADNLRLWDGTNWTTITGVSANPITGIATNLLVNINLHKSRLWYTQINTLKMWYLPTNAITGAAVAFDLSSIARSGGYLMGMWTWTIDAGYGVDDLAVFITSEGEVIVYRGTDPSSSTTWALVGIFAMGRPLGRRCAMKFAGDLLILTQDGIVPLSGALQSSRTNPKVALSDKIQQAFSDSATLYGDTFGWSLVYHASENALVANVPVAVGSQQQYVMNTITKAWAKFTGWNANCWELLGNDVYFGGSTFVAKAFSGYADGSTNITGYAQQAYNYFGQRGVNKRYTLARPIIQATSAPAIQMNVAVDFNDTQPTSNISLATSSSGTWDTATWDSGLWGGGLNVYRYWQGITGVGFCASPYLIGVTNGNEIHWQSTDVNMELGGVL